MANAGKIMSCFSQRPWIISLTLVVVLVLWVVSGYGNEHITSSNNDENVAPLTRVLVKTFFAESVTRSISLYGRTAPDRQAMISAEADGRIISISVKKGSSVKKGTLLLNIDQGDRDAQLARANAIMLVREKEYNASKSLNNKGLQGEVALSLAKANLVESRTNVEKLLLSLSHTEVRAPFDGVVDDVMVEVGEYLGVGDPFAILVDLDPLIVTVDVSELHIGLIDRTLLANIRLVSGKEMEGRLRYQSSIASNTTNTFAIELEILNPDQELSAGISAEVDLALAQQRAVKLLPSMLALDESGNLGVKTLQGDNVVFVAARLVKAEQDGVWLSGLGEQVDVITKGQGFVRDGDTVIAIRQSDTH